MYALYFLIILFFSNTALAMKPKDHSVCVSVQKNAIDKTVGQSIKWHEEQYTVIERHEDSEHVHIVIARPTHKLMGMPLVVEYVSRQFNKSDKLTNHGVSTHALSEESKKILATTATVSAIIAAYLCLH